MARLALAVLPALLLAGCPVIGEPGSANAPVIHDEVDVGALAITEVHADPATSRPQWIEIQNVSDDQVSLLTCTIRDLGENEHEVTIGSAIRLEPGEYGILARADFIGSAEGELPALFNVDGLVFADDDSDETIEIECPDGRGGGQIVASVTYNWDAERHRRGRSRQFTGDPTNPDDLNDHRQWCPAPAQDDTVFYEGDSTEYGTPLADAVCEVPGGARPTVPGDVLITELLIGDTSGFSREWIELHNPTEQAMDIRRCRLEDASIVEADDVKRHTFDYEAGNTVIPAGGYLLVSKTSTDIFYELTTPEQTASYAYSTVAFTNEELQSLALQCPDGFGGVTEIDWMYFDWEPYNDDFRGYSWSLSADALDAESNDDIAAWCLADAQDLLASTTTDDDPPVLRQSFGTPGAENRTCPEPPREPKEGELVITEILIKRFTGLRNWFEVYNATGDDLSLLGCRLTKEETDGSEPSIHDFEFGGGQTTIGPGEFLTLARTDLDISPDGTILADYAYGLGSSGAFITSRAQRLRIECPGGLGFETIDEIVYDWDPYDGAEDGTSIVLSHDFLTAVENDNPDNWCLAEPADVYWSDTTVDPPLVATGTPGASTTICPVPARYPLEGEVVITEIMGDPEFGDTEWFEIKNVSGEELRLHECRLDDVDSTPTHHLIDDDDLVIPIDGYLVFVSNSADADLCSLPWAYDYTSISFNNSGTETLQLSCPDAANPGSLLLIDEQTHNGSVYDDGISWQLNQNLETAVANDLEASWCSADPALVTTPYSWSCVDPSGATTDTNYGTPGGPANCP